VHQAGFPVFDSKHLEESAIEYPVSVNGKLRATLVFDVQGKEEDIKAAAMELDPIKKWTEGLSVVKIIVVPKRILVVSSLQILKNELATTVGEGFTVIVT
jgi:leucyl-tRNA synthetase